MRKFGSNTSEKEAKNLKMIPKMQASYAKRTKWNEAKILFICFANWSENHVKRTVFRFHFAWSEKKIQAKKGHPVQNWPGELKEAVYQFLYFKMTL
jgi:superfamily I DNA and RNA helicase